PLVSPKASAPGISLTSAGQPRYSRLRAGTSLALGGRRPLRRGRPCGEPSRGPRRSLRRYRRAAVVSRGVLSVGVRRKRAGGRRGVRRCRAGDQVSAAPLAVPCAICAILALVHALERGAQDACAGALPPHLRAPVPTLAGTSL